MDAKRQYEVASAKCKIKRRNHRGHREIKYQPPLNIGKYGIHDNKPQLNAYLDAERDGS